MTTTTIMPAPAAAAGLMAIPLLLLLSMLLILVLMLLPSSMAPHVARNIRAKAKWGWGWWEDEGGRSRRDDDDDDDDGGDRRRRHHRRDGHRSRRRRMRLRGGEGVCDARRCDRDDRRMARSDISPIMMSSMSSILSSLSLRACAHYMLDLVASLWSATSPFARLFAGRASGTMMPSRTEPTKATTAMTSTAATLDRAMDDYYAGTAVVGLDCEMVGGGRGGRIGMLARCSVVTLSSPRVVVLPGIDEDVDGWTEAADDGNATTTTTTTKIAIVTATNDGLRGREYDCEGRIRCMSSTTTTTTTTKAAVGPGGLDEGLVVLYDKIVIPRWKVTDYRTEYSGITRDTYKGDRCDGGDCYNSTIPIVSFEQCRNEVSRLFASIGGKRVVVVGHALDNDFEALEIDHPPLLTRDTAFYRPYMRESRKRMYPRKLSTLTSEELGISIQQKSSSVVGHSSVEDAAAALRLYWHENVRWERSLGHPLLGIRERTSQRRRIPLRMYLDGCNLPIGCRGVDFNALLGSNNINDGGMVVSDDGSRVTRIPPEEFRLTSRVRQNRNGNHSSSNISTIDWIPIFRSALSPQSALGNITVMFDGAKYASAKRDNERVRRVKAGGGVDTRKFRLDSSSSTTSDDRGSIEIEITEDGDSTDDVLVRTTSRGEDADADVSASDIHRRRRIISLEEVINIFSSDADDAETDAVHYSVVIRRKAGGTKTHRRLFDKLHLRRPNEGAVCLSSLTPGLRRSSLRIARELEREKCIERVIECERRCRDELRFVVVTNDVYLCDRLVRDNDRVLVLSYMQLTTMW